MIPAVLLANAIRSLPGNQRGRVHAALAALYVSNAPGLPAGDGQQAQVKVFVEKTVALAALPSRTTAAWAGSYNMAELHPRLPSWVVRGGGVRDSQRKLSRKKQWHRLPQMVRPRGRTVACLVRAGRGRAVNIIWAFANFFLVAEPFFLCGIVANLLRELVYKHQGRLCRKRNGKSGNGIFEPFSGVLLMLA